MLREGEDKRKKNTAMKTKTKISDIFPRRNKQNEK